MTYPELKFRIVEIFATESFGCLSKEEKTGRIIEIAVATRLGFFGVRGAGAIEEKLKRSWFVRNTSISKKEIVKIALMAVEAMPVKKFSEIDLAGKATQVFAGLVAILAALANLKIWADRVIGLGLKTMLLGATLAAMNTNKWWAMKETNSKILGLGKHLANVRMARSATVGAGLVLTVLAVEIIQLGNEAFSIVYPAVAVIAGIFWAFVWWEENNAFRKEVKKMQDQVNAKPNAA